MAIDRLAAIRAGGGGGFHDSSRETPAVGPSPESFTLAALDGRAPDDDFSAISAIEDQLAGYKAAVKHISELHTHSLGLTDDVALQQDTAQLNQAQTGSFEISSDIRRRIQALHNKAEKSKPRNVALAQHVARLQEKFRESIQEYRSMEQGYQARYRERVERQFRIVKPDATPEEIRTVMDDPEAGAQIFSNAVATSNRYGESRAAYREAQDRHADIRRIERTVEELGHLFNEMAVLVAQDDDKINAVQQTAARVADDLEKGEAAAQTAAEHAAAARKKRIWCFVIWLIILAVVAIAVAVPLSQTLH
ncbi:uncharacterized protein EI90DRAFT_3129066 [Cantharellus anzutake]|uniref:uncharacterized protein n=1 Tax=Cantharellus anzutake TaxID=1750568 RepID=UPI0019054C3B|nr:uncharacterized protein EI90DRAFT_3129066 [Cantharellus anzutake]KAF8325233.1 hypothetical protein EI90DRAFT_3129066 [Cantharellus anzutake]